MVPGDSIGENDRGRIDLSAHIPVAEFGWGDIVIFCAEYGMGKTSLLMHIAHHHIQQGHKVRIEDFDRMLPREAVTRLSELARWGMAQARHKKRCLLVFDNLPSLDEDLVQGFARTLRKLAASGAMLALGMLPEASALCEALGEAKCYWSCDLRVDGTLQASYAKGRLEETHGIPALVFAAHKQDASPSSNLLTDPRFQEPFVGLLENALRPSLLGEEYRLRLALMLMGAGSFAEVSFALGAIDADLWRYLARDAPLFGVDVSHGTFRCVGTYTADGLNVGYSTLKYLGAPFPDLVVAVARELVHKEAYERACIVATMCEDGLQRCSFILEGAADFVNAGELGAVADALGEAREQGWIGLRGFDDAQVIVRALEGEGADAGTYAVPSLEAGSRQSTTAGLARWAVGLLGDAPRLEECDDRLEADSLRCGLALHGNSMVRMLQGRITEAYGGLLNTPWRLREDLVGALLQADFLLCSFLAGIVPERADMWAWQKAQGFLERSGMGLLVSLGDVVVPLGRAMAGRRRLAVRYETHIHRAERLGLDVLQALLLLVTAIGDLRDGALTRAHVRLERALGLFERAGVDVGASKCRLLDIAVRTQLGERVARKEVMSCRGVTAPVDHVATIVMAALTPTHSDRPAGAGRWANTRCPHDVYWLVNTLISDFGAFSRRVREVMPPLWRDGVLNASDEIDSLFEEAETRAEGQGDEGDEPGVPEQPEVAVHSLLHISLLGGLEVRVCGQPIPARRLDRRRAKGLIALLAALPEHAVKRFVIMESIWPGHDYRTAGKCVYCATSVLRSEIAALAEGIEGTKVIVTNRAEGTVALDSAYVACDVDEFEKKARLVLDKEGSDRLVVSLCNELEELYKGDMYVPPTDGMGLMHERSRALRSLFADAMVAGSRAAANLESRMLACRLAEKAFDAEPMREDAIEAVTVAFCAAGRCLEAERLYEGYVGSVVQRTRKPPSKRLRQVVNRHLSAARGEGAEGQMRIDFGEGPNGLAERV